MFVYVYKDATAVVINIKVTIRLIRNIFANWTAIKVGLQYTFH